ncbi:thioesterase domain-containing protein [Halorarius halobius]|uniref:thioesterase domain-containing protein n=1 Tax=Halorarius halobius TaxID=2962671 RepID=UPI0020CB7336|nr:thioesterase domain-containing protein [Halorarius halobius]
MSEDVLVPGGRDVRASLDNPDADACVVACPPHPQMGGRRTDARLRAVSDALAGAAATLRFDYGDWDEGYGELADARNALAWAREEYETVSVFGYSFGGCIALLTAARESEAGTPPAAVAALAPAARLNEELDAAAALDAVTCPGLVVYGERDTTAEWEPVVERARDLNWSVEEVPADHHFVGQAEKVGERVAAFLRGY